MGYDHDLFISYKRGGNTGDWVLNHLVPVLKECLFDELGRKPEVWFDQEQEIGTRWPANLQRGLLHSRLLLAVWSPPYFSSPWCLAEWKSMLAREHQLGMSTPNRPSGLVYPIVFSDGTRFPDRAKQTQSKQDLSKWAYPYRQFSQSLEYLQFHDCVKVVAEQIAERIDGIPDWQEGWPIEMPPGDSNTDVPLPRL